MPKPDSTQQTNNRKEIRITLALSQAGICSRRDADRLVAQGRVSLNRSIVTQPYTRVCPQDQIAVDGVLVSRSTETRLWRFHKPNGCISTTRDPEGRRTVFELLPPNLPRVISIGRLDYNSEGLLLLTTSGQLARKLELPASGWTRKYRVRAYGSEHPDMISQLARGVTLDGIVYAPIFAQIESRRGGNLWLNLALTEGKNREVRVVLSYFGLTVNRLIRTSFGPFNLGDLPAAQTEEVDLTSLQL